MFNPFRNINAENLFISQSQLKNAKVYPSRWEWIDTLPKNIEILEVGVAAGDFSNKILNSLNPKRLVLLDMYKQCDPMLARGDKPLRYLEGENLSFVKDRFKNYSQVEFIVGPSQVMLDAIKGKFDMIYLDASHVYEDIVIDIEKSIPLLKDDGILAINDYVLYSGDGNVYGVIEATNKFLKANPDWEVIGISLSNDMCCDLYLRKIL